MVKTKLPLLSLSIALLSPALAATPADSESSLAVGAIVEVPGFATGGCAEFLSFPWQVDFGIGAETRIGWGAQGAVLYSFDAAGLVIPLQALVAARFGFLKDVPISARLRAGIWLTPSGTLFAGGLDGTIDFSSFRLGASINVFPLGITVALSFIAQVSYVVPL